MKFYHSFIFSRDFPGAVEHCQLVSPPLCFLEAESTSELREIVWKLELSLRKLNNGKSVIPMKCFIREEQEKKVLSKDEREPSKDEDWGKRAEPALFFVYFNFGVWCQILHTSETKTCRFPKKSLKFCSRVSPHRRAWKGVVKPKGRYYIYIDIHKPFQRMQECLKFVMESWLGIQ